MKVTCIGLLRPAVMRLPNGAQCDVCKRTEVFDRSEALEVLDMLRTEGWLLPPYTNLTGPVKCNECLGKDTTDE